MNMSLKSILCHVSQSDMKVKVVMNQGLFIPCVFIFCRTSDNMIIAGNLDLGNKETRNQRLFATINSGKTFLNFS